MRPIGVTLIELVFVLAIIALLVCVGVPALHMTSANVVRQRCVQEWSEVLRYARIQALLQQRPLKVLPLLAANWAQGVRLQAEEVVLREWHWDHPGTQMTWHGFNSNQQLSIADDVAQMASNGYFKLEYGGEPLARIVVTRLGRVY